MVLKNDPWMCSRAKNLKRNASWFEIVRMCDVNSRLEVLPLYGYIISLKTHLKQYKQSLHIQIQLNLFIYLFI